MHRAGKLGGMASAPREATSHRRGLAGDLARGNGRLPETERLPRTQVGTTPQHLLMTLLGHYWFDRGELLPSGGLADFLAELGIGEPSARTALNRLTRRGLLVSSKRG